LDESNKFDEREEMEVIRPNKALRLQGNKATKITGVRYSQPLWQFQEIKKTYPKNPINI
jgi:hypothetical protein